MDDRDRPVDPATRDAEGDPVDQREEDALDEALDESFPASDPPAISRHGH
jgi:hypothetical protein